MILSIGVSRRRVMITAGASRLQPRTGPWDNATDAMDCILATCAALTLRSSALQAGSFHGCDVPQVRRCDGTRFHDCRWSFSTAWDIRGAKSLVRGHGVADLPQSRQGVRAGDRG